MKTKILIVAEHSPDEMMPLTLEMIACAREIKRQIPAQVAVAVLGKDILSQASALAAEAGIDAIAVTGNSLEQYTAEAYISALYELACELRPDLIIIPHSPRGYDYAPQVAVKLNAACISGVAELDFCDGKIGFCRQGFHGKMTIAMESLRPVTVITILPGAFQYDGKIAEGKGAVTNRRTQVTLKATRSVATISAEEQDTNLRDAETIIAAGKGIEKIENVELLKELAKVFPKSAIAGSRVACDQGWIAQGLQIGLTGKTVAPKLYIACGISGALQHIAGMKDSQTIVAINRDPTAAIFQHADFGIVEDINTFIPALIMEFREKKA
jgi:electron transfer flavoprotein alpha subunit